MACVCAQQLSLNACDGSIAINFIHNCSRCSCSNSDSSSYDAIFHEGQRQAGQSSNRIRRISKTGSIIVSTESITLEIGELTHLYFLRVFSVYIVGSNHSAFGTIKHIGVEVTIRAGLIQIGVAKSNRICEPIFLREQLVLLINAQLTANKLSPIFGQDLQLLTWLDVVQINDGVFHAS